MRYNIIRFTLRNINNPVAHSMQLHYIILKQSDLTSSSKHTIRIQDSSKSTHSINITLIVISNTSLFNPGPVNGTSSHISVMYHNVQGLIPFSNLGDKCPNLDQTKIYGLKSSIAINKPDIIVLNETWLKKSILDNEILDPKFYKIYRLDRSQETHPLYPENIKKIRKNGGGVLIGVGTQLVLTSSIIKIKFRAELLAVAFEFLLTLSLRQAGAVSKKNI